MERFFANIEEKQNETMEIQMEDMEEVKNIYEKESIKSDITEKKVARFTITGVVLIIASLIYAFYILYAHAFGKNIHTVGDYIALFSVFALLAGVVFLIKSQDIADQSTYWNIDKLSEVIELTQLIKEHQKGLTVSFRGTALEDMYYFDNDGVMVEIDTSWTVWLNVKFYRAENITFCGRLDTKNHDYMLTIYFPMTYK